LSAPGTTIRTITASMTCTIEFHEGALVMKKILLLIAAVVGALAIQKKFRDQQAEQDLWAEATDKV
jgi:hypothetical protein